MREHERISTSPEVWAVIKIRHGNILKVFGSFSDPDGEFSGGVTGEMKTSYGFDGANCPLMEARTTWTINREKSYERIDEKHEYWLCVSIDDD